MVAPVAPNRTRSACAGRGAATTRGPPTAACPATARRRPSPTAPCTVAGQPGRPGRPARRAAAWPSRRDAASAATRRLRMAVGSAWVRTATRSTVAPTRRVQVRVKGSRVPIPLTARPLTVARPRSQATPASGRRLEPVVGLGRVLGALRRRLQSPAPRLRQPHPRQRGRRVPRLPAGPRAVQQPPVPGEPQAVGLDALALGGGARPGQRQLERHLDGAPLPVRLPRADRGPRLRARHAEQGGDAALQRQRLQVG